MPHCFHLQVCFSPWWTLESRVNEPQSYGEEGLPVIWKSLSIQPAMHLARCLAFSSRLASWPRLAWQFSAWAWPFHTDSFLRPLASTSLSPSYHTQPLSIVDACALLLLPTSPALCREAFLAGAGFQARLNSFLANWKLAVFLSFDARRGFQPCASGVCHAPSHCASHRT